MKLNGSQILMECLLEQGVDTVFGYPGGAIMPVYDALHAYSDRIQHILTAHEQGASHAADGYARSSGKVGVCMATSGPGATNLVTGIATAYMDSSPVVFVTCNVNEHLIGKDSFQEVDITGIAMPITKNTYLVRDVEKLADVVREAFAVARGGRPGPVLIDIVRNATLAQTDYTPLPREKHATSGRLGALIHRASRDNLCRLGAPEPDREDIDLLVDMIDQSKKPLVICGGGVVRSRADEEFKTFVECIDSPVAVTVMGGGGISGRNPLTTGMIGMHGTQASNHAADRCDLLISVGCRFSDRVGLNFDSFAQNAKIVHIDIDRSEIDKNVQTDHHIIGDARQVLALLNQKVSQRDNSAWKEEVFSFPAETIYEDTTDTLTPKQVLSSIAKILPDDTIAATDVGQHQMWAVQHFRFDYPGQLITSGGFGAMGFGLGAAIGAKAANPEKTVLHITGDGSFRMNSQEMSTEEYYDLPIITCIFNNGVLGMVRQWQHLIFEKRYSQTTLDRGPDFVALANAYGLPARRVSTVEELEDALHEAMELGTGYVIDCAIGQHEMARPMISAGDHITQFLVD
ncbi:MAG: biosynthetic-type acetolactate synthase large subunit [Coriobacteriia bacterium]|nr:biosynthetic-type acetolactate synthase large subunit [Coriobacteriia bacterium]